APPAGPGERRYGGAGPRRPPAGGTLARPARRPSRPGRRPALPSPPTGGEAALHRARPRAHPRCGATSSSPAPPSSPVPFPAGWKGSARDGPDKDGTAEPDAIEDGTPPAPPAAGAAGTSAAVHGRPPPRPCSRGAGAAGAAHGPLRGAGSG